MKTFDLSFACAEIGSYNWSNLGDPWLFNGWVYASDGKLAVRVEPERCGNTAIQTEPRSAASMVESWFALERGPAWAWPLNLSEAIHRDVICYDCGGDGTIRYESRKGHMYEHPCAECEGDGRVVRYDPSAFRVGGRLIATELLDRVSHLEPTELREVNHDLLIYFAFDGGEGIAARMRDATSEWPLNPVEVAP